jgi:cysteinyl-tRNA synthetase
MANHPESGNLSQEVREVAIQRAKALATKNYQKADALQKILLDAGYRYLKFT